MRRISHPVSFSLTCLVFFAGLGGACSFRAPSPSPVPTSAARIEAKASSFDFGKVPQGAVVEHRFQLRNTGGQALEIESVQTSCGCTAIVLSNKTLWPGEEGSIEARFDTRSVSGSRARAITVRTNDPETPVLTLTLFGEVESDVRVEPAEVYLGRVGPGSTSTKQIEIAIQSPTVQITRVTSESGLLQIRSSDLEAPSRGLRLTLLVPTHLGPGRFSDSVVVETTSGSQPRLRIPVHGSLESGLSAWPPRLSGGTVAKGSRVGSVELVARGKDPLPELTIQGAPSALLPALETITAGRRYRVNVVAGAQAPVGPVNGEIAIAAAGQSTPLLQIPVEAVIR